MIRAILIIIKKAILVTPIEIVGNLLVGIGFFIKMIGTLVDDILRDEYLEERITARDCWIRGKIDWIKLYRESK